MHHLSATPPPDSAPSRSSQSEAFFLRGWALSRGRTQGGWSLGCVREEGFSGSAGANTNPSLGYPNAIIVDGVVMQSEAEDLLRSRPLFLGRARSLQEAFVEDVNREKRFSFARLWQGRCFPPAASAVGYQKEWKGFKWDCRGKVLWTSLRGWVESKIRMPEADRS